MLWILDDADVPKRPIKVFSLEIFILSLKVMRFSSSLKKRKKKISLASRCSLSRCNYLINHNEYNHKITQIIVGYEFSFFFSGKRGDLFGSWIFNTPSVVGKKKSHCNTDYYIE